MEFDIPEDAYGAAMLALAKDLTDLVIKERISMLTITRLSFPMVVLTVNLVLQFLCLFYINSFVVAPSVHHVQETYGRYHTLVWDKNGKFLEERWNDEGVYSQDEKSNLCQIAMTNQVFYYTVLLLWTVSSMHEIRTAQRLFGNIMRVPRAETLGDQIVVDNVDGSKITIRALKPIVRSLMIGIVVLPKIIISCCLMLLGMRWLSATTSFEELVMNAVSMTFVTQIDELLYHFALPANYRNQVADINFSLDITPEEAERETWFSYVRSAFYCGLTFLIVHIYAEYIQDVLPNAVYKADENCIKWQKDNTKTRCGFTFEHFFRKMIDRGFSASMSTSQQCYPYGEEYTG